MNSDITSVEAPSMVAQKLVADALLSDNMLSNPLPSSRTRVLIVEENGEMREHFMDFLGCEFELVVVANPPAAIAAACMGPFNIVVQDIEYEKEMEAVKLSKQLAQLNYCKDAQFLAITGYVLPEGKSILRRAKYDYLLAKPFTLRQLRDLLRICVAKQTLSILNGINVDIDLPIGTTMALMVEV